MGCVFCGIVAGELPAFRLHEDERTLAFLDIRPWGPGHTLVIPKAHADNLFDIAPQDLRAVMEAARRLAPRLRDALGADGVALAQLSGAAAGQSVFHLHVHLLPRRAGEGIPTGPPPGPPPASGDVPSGSDGLAAVHRRITAALAG